MTSSSSPTKDPAGNAPAGGVRPSCRIPGCEIQASDNRPGYCIVHHDAFLTRAYDLTRDIGRGTLDD